MLVRLMWWAMRVRYPPALAVCSLQEPGAQSAPPTLSLTLESRCKYSALDPHHSSRDGTERLLLIAGSPTAHAVPTSASVSTQASTSRLDLQGIL